MKGYIRGLLWPDRREADGPPGGPYIFGVTDEDMKFSLRINNMWCEGWRSGHRDKLNLKLEIPDNYDPRVMIRINREWSRLENLPMPISGRDFHTGTKVMVTTSALDWANVGVIDYIGRIGLIMHKVEIPGRIFYLVKLDGSITDIMCATGYNLISICGDI
jgi:hypothetical protein